ncbi:flavin reductase family protein [Microbacterium sp. SORGH_AS_0888]|uniref:flavin reductase family protein n=1 Tax=Microbacterium sp. SORGH_AS_0888 TaxID=3041791 RepID=UPI002781A830|nr:flavin reductase family protein [Microbacterium sp. SORGH_AS_0888]MDQ1130439.1 flavin reductase (DIM6/NTAB) family NADH-FMN oxidoreductase RutF [Microbacterium sp. SORGH_AS_0888]
MLAPYDSDTRALRDAFAAFPCGVAALAATVDGDRQILVASSFTVGVSQEPPLVMFAVQRSSTTWPVLARAQALGVSILGESHAEKTRQLASREKAARFVGIDTYTSERGALFLEGAAVWMECVVEDTHAAGDHEIVVLRVLGLRTEAHRPLVWHRSSFTRLAS